MHSRFLEDFSPGTFDLPASVKPSRDDIIAYARQYDPQPFHLDEDAAKQTFAGGLIASGWHSCALQMRLVADGLLRDSSCMGAPGIEEVQWLKPVRAGDTLRTRCTVVDTKVSRSRPEMGLVRFRFELFNRRDEVVLRQVNWIMFGRRDSPPPSAGAGGRESRSGEGSGEVDTAALLTASDSPPLPQRREGIVPYLDDLALGETHDLGSHVFEASEIIRFAKAFDPQPFHTDPETAERSHFGGLCASGWHTAAVWMKLMVEHRHAARDAALAAGDCPAELGTSPGFTDLRWFKPVYAGDRITYASTLVDKRASASRPGWGLAFHRNTGANQLGEEVFAFTGAVFWERR